MRTALRWTFFALGLALGVTELVALLNGQASDTASEFVWSLPLWARIVVALGCAWLSVHFGFKVLPRPGKRRTDVRE
ncbi:MAG TPA: hypothetical protein VIP77_16110 [Jiangellaceae bacterium]